MPTFGAGVQPALGVFCNPRHGDYDDAASAYGTLMSSGALSDRPHLMQAALCIQGDLLDQARRNGITFQMRLQELPMVATWTAHS